MDTGRWTIISRALPARRRQKPCAMRQRVNVRCVCGAEQVVWIEDLECGRSKGCVSKRCAAKFGASREMRNRLLRWSKTERDTLLRMARSLPAELRERLEQMAQQLYQERYNALDRAIERWLRESDEDPLDDEAAHA